MAEFPTVVELNVGGTYFTTRLSTLTKDKDSMLAAMFSGRHRVEQDSQGRYFIDRDGKLFHHILTYLRHDKLPPPDMALDVLEEAEYYQVTGLVDWCKTQDVVVMKELSTVANQEEQPPGGHVLTTEIIGQLARQSILGNRVSALEHGIDDKLTSWSKVVFIGNGFRLGEASRMKVYQVSRPAPGKLPNTFEFQKSRDYCCVGVEADHQCTVGGSGTQIVNLAVYCDDVVNPVVYVERALSRFNQVANNVRVDLENIRNKAHYAKAIVSVCRVCQKEVFLFCFRFLFRATPN